MIIALAGHDIRPTMGFHRVIELLPDLAKEGLRPEILIPGNIRKHRWPLFRRDFLAFLKSSSARRQVRFRAKPVSRGGYSLLLKQADLVIFPYEAGGFSAIYSDALYLGKPVVVSDLEGLEKAAGKTRAGLVVKNSSELRDAIISFFKNRNLRKRLEQNAASLRKR